MNGLEQAWRAAGSRTKLAKALGVAPSTVTMWQVRGRIPAERVPAIEMAFGVHRYVLRPDLYEIPARGRK